MSDLISRSQLLKEIETWGGCVEALHEYIRNMPTAYDVDKVVEQLNNLKRYSNPYDIYYEEASYRATEFENSVVNRLIDDVIKIVKVGGRDER